MSLPDDYLSYPKRAYGHDHAWFKWDMLQQRAPVQWPHGQRLAIWINVSLQHYPLNQQGVPFKVPNGMTMPYPDLRHYSLRDYGNRVGVFRVMAALAKARLRATWAINAELAQTNPWLVKRIAQESGAEIVAHGWNMDTLHHNGMTSAEEAQCIDKCRQLLSDVSGQAVSGWLSPARQESWRTLELLSKAGFAYCMDWVNDDMPYAVLPDQGELHMMPLNTEIEDQFLMCNNLHSEDSWAQQVTDAVDFMLEEAEHQGQGRMLGISIHPWLVGQPHRMACLEHVLAHLQSKQGIWVDTAQRILGHWREQQESAT